ncbi:MAG: hypothetical protein RMK52_08545 [Chitinophagales bacterium]|nr:hypothetical protein [Chitinophagales bacterium]
MKPLLILTLAALVAASCSTSSKTARVETDDIYVSKTTPTGKPAQTQQPGASGNYSEENRSDAPDAESRSSQPDYSYSEQYSDEQGNTYITNNYYYGNNYDFYDSYSSRLSRWYDPYCGFSYFSPYYLGWSWGYPVYYTPGFSFSIHFGWGYGWYYPWYNPWYYPPAWYSWYSPWYYDPWYSPWGWNPYWAYGYPYYGSYWHGYWHGYYHGYNDALGWGSGRYYYGPRGSSSSNVPGSSGGGRQFRTGNDNTVMASAVSVVNRPVQRPATINRSHSVQNVIPALQGKPSRPVETPSHAKPAHPDQPVSKPYRPEVKPVPEGIHSPNRPSSEPVRPQKPSQPKNPSMDKEQPGLTEPQMRPRNQQPVPPKGMGQRMPEQAAPGSSDKYFEGSGGNKKVGFERMRSSRPDSGSGQRLEWESSGNRNVENSRSQGGSSSGSRPSGSSNRPPR